MHAQRAAAWSGVARRIAHEIKNPLTPIQLSAERLRRNFRNDRGSADAELFDACIGAIVRQVGAIRAMADEFSSFARMPAPSFSETDPAPAVEEAVSMQALAHPGVAFSVAPPPRPMRVRCDAVQLGQALANLLRNAADAIAARRPASGGGAPEKGRVRVEIREREGGAWSVCVADNGRGLPPDPAQRARLTEPYITTREGGTGLGLAIVKKIMEDHGGRLALDDEPRGGARVCLEFPPRGAAGPPAAGTGERASAMARDDGRRSDHR